MEVKKSPKADLQNKKSIFFQIGLVVVLCAAIAFFSYSQGQQHPKKVVEASAPIDPDLIDPTTQEEEKPEPVRIAVSVVEILRIIDTDSVLTGSLEEMFPEGDVIVELRKPVEEAVEDDTPFLKVEQMPQFQGGDINTFRAWVQGRLRYPDIASENGISGRVTLAFVIEKDGSLTNIAVLQSPDRSLSEEAMRVLKTSPKWTPGKQRNMPARVRYNLPVTFTIQQ